MSEAHHYFDGEFYFVDSAFLRQAERVMPGFHLKNLGFGEFSLEGPSGKIDFDLMRGKNFPNQYGRSMRLYDNKGGDLIQKLISSMADKSIEVRTDSISKLAQLYRQAGEVRFVKDRGSDDKEWGWGTQNPLQREIDPEYKFKVKNLEPLAKALRSALMALGHVQTAYSTFTKIKSRNISPDGSLGGKGYIMKVTDMRRQLMNSSEALSAITDTIYDELSASHWHPATESQDPRERKQVKEIMEDVEEIRRDPEEWAEEEEEELETSTEKKAFSVLGKVNSVASRYLRSRRI